MKKLTGEQFMHMVDAALQRLFYTIKKLFLGEACAICNEI